MGDVIMKTILVTGGAGFIGSNLVDNLILEKDNKIIIIDNFNDFYNPNIKESNINEIKENMKKNNIEENRLVVYRVDIRDKSKINKIFDKEDINLVIHLAAMAGVRPSIEQPELYYDVNINGTLNLLEACKRNNIRKFILASSSSVYGNNKKVPFSENDTVDNPISPYAATKKSCELLCHTYHYLYNISIACLRFFTVYGPRQRPDLAIHKFTKLIMKDKEIPFFGDGSTERDYTYIDDIVDGIDKTIEWIYEDKNKFEIFNLGESQTISLKYMVETIEESLGKKAMKNILPMQPGDVMRTNADISKARKILGYNPSTNFELGISSFIKWIEKQIKV